MIWLQIVIKTERRHSGANSGSGYKSADLRNCKQRFILKAKKIEMRDKDEGGKSRSRLHFFS